MRSFEGSQILSEHFQEDLWHLSANLAFYEVAAYLIVSRTVKLAQKETRDIWMLASKQIISSAYQNIQKYKYINTNTNENTLRLPRM